MRSGADENVSARHCHHTNHQHEPGQAPSRRPPKTAVRFVIVAMDPGSMCIGAVGFRTCQL